MDEIEKEVQEEPEKLTDKDDFVVNPQVGDYRMMRLGKTNHLAVVTDSNPIMVKYFDKTSNRYVLGDNKFEAAISDFLRKVQDPEIVLIGRNRLHYIFHDV